MTKSDYQDLQYVGSFSTLQTEGNSQYMNHGAISLNKTQNSLYSRLLKGRKHYTKQELFAMNSGKKKRIDKAHRKAQDLLNLWKQELMILNSNLYLEKYRTENWGDITSLLSSLSAEPDPKFRCTLSFKELGINKEKIIGKFLEARLLPDNFMQLEDEAKAM